MTLESVIQFLVAVFMLVITCGAGYVLFSLGFRLIPNGWREDRDRRIIELLNANNREVERRREAERERDEAKSAAQNAVSSRENLVAMANHYGRRTGLLAALEVVPGGDTCRPQQIADDIRELIDKLYAGNDDPFARGVAAGKEIGEKLKKSIDETA